MTSIHPNAIVHPGAEMGNNVSIGPFSVIEENVIIGDDCRIESQALIASGARLGKAVTVCKGAVLGTQPQDLKYAGEKTILEIGEGTTIREFATVNRGTSYSGKTVIGKNCYLMAYSHVAHDCVLGEHVILANVVQLAGHVEIEDHATIGGMSAVHQFTRIGAYAFIGGGYRVAKDVPPYILAMGEPLQYGGVNHIGLTRHGFSKETLAEIKRAYRLIFRSNLNRAEAIRQIQETLTQLPEVQHIIAFVENASGE